MSGGEPLHLEGRQISEFKASLDDILIEFSARQDCILKLCLNKVERKEISVYRDNRKFSQKSDFYKSDLFLP